MVTQSPGPSLDADAIAGHADRVHFVLAIEPAAEVGLGHVHDLLEGVGEGGSWGEPRHTQIGEHRDILDGEATVMTTRLSHGQQVVDRLVVDVAVEVDPWSLTRLGASPGSRRRNWLMCCGWPSRAGSAKSQGDRPSGRRPGPISQVQVDVVPIGGVVPII